MNVSTAWRKNIQAQFRYPGHMLIELNVTPPGLREGATVTSTSTSALTTTNAILDGSTEVSGAAATLEPQRWRGDGSMFLLSQDTTENRLQDWWSDNANTATLEFVFNAAYSFPGIIILWDQESGSWATSATLQTYSLTDKLLGTYELVGTGVETTLEQSFDDVARVVLTINSWSRQGWRPRITEITFGRYLQFTNDVIQAAKLTAQADLVANELPSAGISAEVANYNRSFDPLLAQGYSKYLAERQLVKVQWGFETTPGNTEWLAAWPLYLSSWNVPADQQTVSLTTVSRSEFLTDEYTKGVYTGTPVSFKTFLTGILNESPIIRNYAEETPWELDDVLTTMQTRAPAPVEAYNVLVQLVANATGCIYSNDITNGYIRVQRGTMDAGYDITQLQQVGDPSFKISDRLKSVEIGLRTFSQRSSKEQIYSFTGRIVGTKELKISYDQDCIAVSPTATISGATILSQIYYARRAVLVVQASADGADVDLSIQGYIVDESTTFIQTYNDPEISDGVTVTLDNPLITEMSTVNVIAEIIKEYYLRRTEATIPYLGYPDLEVAQLLDFRTNYGEFPGEIKQLSLDFNGGFSGSLTVQATRGRADQSSWISGEIRSGEV